MKPSKLITQLIAIVITVLAGVAYAAATNWTPPVGIPPAANTDAPINVGGNAQEKLGGLILGSGLSALQPALVLPTGNLLMGTAVVRPAPNGSGSNLDVNDIYIRSSNTWASTLSAAAPASTCTPTNWAPAVNASDVCAGSVATQVKTNADCSTSAQSINGTKDCSTPVGSAYTPGEWFNDKLRIDYDQNDPDGNWSTQQEVRFTAGHAINRIRVRGNSNDGGYCYVYWGTGHTETYRHTGNTGIYNENGTWYSDQPSYTPALTDMGGLCWNGDSNTAPCARNYCADGSDPIIFSGGDGGTDTAMCLGGNDICPTYPPTFSNNGIAKICQITWNAGPMTPVDWTSNVPVPEGAVVTLQGRHTIGDREDNIHCAIDIQYAP